MPEKLRNFLKWFFEEEKEEEKPDECLEISLWQVIILVIITIVFLIWIFYAHLRGFSYKPTLTAEKYINTKIEKDFFIKNNVIENGNFSGGLEHWATSDGGKIFPKSKSEVGLDKKEFLSAPYSMKITSIFPANRYYYSKDAKVKLINNPYDYHETSHWMGVAAGYREAVASLWYKGDIVTFYLQSLNEKGNWEGLGVISGIATDKWRKLKIREKIPQECRAIAIEITLNQAQGAPHPVVFIDDVGLTVK